MQALHEQYAEQGLRVLGFPANDFGGQEPGTNAEIAEFCTSRFDVSFQMFTKIQATGEDRHPFLTHLVEHAPPADEQGDAIRWNFEKFLIGRDGEVLARWRSGEEPTGEAITDAIEAALASGE